MANILVFQLAWLAAPPPIIGHGCKVCESRDSGGMACNRFETFEAWIVHRAEAVENPAPSLALRGSWLVVSGEGNMI